MASDSTSAASQGQGLHETTSSRCVTETFTATHNFEVSDFSLLEGIGVGDYVSSSTFTVGGYLWNILLYPNGQRKECQGDYVSVFLRCCRGESTSAVRVRTRCSLSMVDKDGRESKLPLLRDYMTYMRIFHPGGKYWGWPQFILKYQLRHFLYLNDDSLTIRCTLTVFKSRTEDVINTTLISVPPANLHQDLEHMLEDMKGVDVTFDVDGQLFYAHRCVLSARSPVFDAELFGPLKKDPAHPIKIDDMDPTIFEGLLHFIYTDSLPEADHCNSDENTTMQHLLVAADRYGLERLRVMCEDKLCRGVDVQTVATSLALAEQHNCVKLREACIRFIASRDVLSAVMETDGFKHLQGSCPLIPKEISDEVATARRRRTSLQQLWSCRRDDL